jgi:hypothetical protein
MDLRPVAKGAKNVGSLMSIPTLVSDFEDVQKSEEREEVNDGTNLKMVAHRNTASPPSPSTRRRVQDLGVDFSASNRFLE